MSTGRVDPSYLASLQVKTSNIRNFCILAHVDHGKTTLSDSLVCSNGVISPKLAGKLRFLDSTEEEQRRGITMHSSAIALLYRLEDKATKDKVVSQEDISSPSATSSTFNEEYLINLVDSPGHIDFSSDVSTATRLCDGALIVVDVLEGLCTQTHAVLYKALKERMKPCLVLNKMDRLVLEMKLTPLEAFNHLHRIIENINALVFSLVTSELRSIAELEGLDPNIEINEDSPFVQEWNFSPEKGNVIFASAIDCWGFSITKFANIWSKKLGVNKSILQKYFFEYYTFHSKTLKISKCDSSDPSSKPMFATMILEPIWQIYDTAIIQEDPEKASKMAHRGLNVEIPPREINTRDPRSTVQAIFRRWLPLPDALLRMIVRSMPNPLQSQKSRITNLMINPTSILRLPSILFNSIEPITTTSTSSPSSLSILSKMEKVYSDIESCNTSEKSSEVTVFISKMTPIRAGDLSASDLHMIRHKRQILVEEAISLGHEIPEGLNDTIDSSTEIFMALGRVFSGVLTRNTNLYVLGNRYDPLSLSEKSIELLESGQYFTYNSQQNHSTEVAVHSIKKLSAGSFGLYICLGPSAYPVEQVYAGNIVGIIGLESHLFKTGTLSSTWATLPMKAITFQAKPMVKVALEPLSHLDISKLEKGLQILYQYDPVVEVGIDDNGQHTMTCLGELHLELCLKTLIDKFAKCEIKASEPLVSFRETILTPEFNFNSNVSPSTWLPSPWKDIPDLERASNGRCRLCLSAQNVAITFRCFPLPITTAKILDDNIAQVTILADYVNSIEKPDNLPDSRSCIPVIAFWSKLYHSMLDSSIDSVLKSSQDGSNNNEWNGIDVLHRLVSLGPKSIGPNMLFFDQNIESVIYSSTIPKDKSNQIIINTDDVTANVTTTGSMGKEWARIRRLEKGSLFHKLWAKIHGAVVAGFQVVTGAGPIMQEPLYGVGYAIEEIEYSYAAISSSLSSNDIKSILSLQNVTQDMITSSTTIEGNDMNPSDSITQNSAMIMMGQLISEVKDTLRLCMLSCPMRVVEPIYACELQCDQSQLGNLYSVLSKRRGEVTKEDIIDGTTLFLLSATLPVVESFSFAQELLNKTSGNGTAPQLRFSHWNRMEQDPFWRARTAEELEEFGDQNNELNKTRILVDKIRKRKGLPIEEKVVIFAEKQRTLRK